MERPESLLERLEKYCPGAVPMHMPGHKRNIALAPYLARLGADIDITEIDGFDDLHDADGVLAEGMARAARLWGAKRSFFGVNGSTGGVLAAVFSALETGDEVICARNCHKSVYNALELRRARAHFIFPRREEHCGTACIVTPEAVRSALEHYPAARAVIITSPTYEGVVSDVRGIAAAAHERGAALIVDEAHGAHLGFGGGFPDGAVHSGADIVVQSLHKTLPSLTQTAMLHVSGDIIPPERVARYMAVFESSSPSYLLMASIDGCVRLLESEGAALFARWSAALDAFRAALRLKSLSLMEKAPGMFALDPSKLVISCRESGIFGAELMSRLRRESGIELEMAAAGHAIAMSGMGDTEKTLLRLAEALNAADSRLERSAAYALPRTEPPEVFCQSWETAGADAVSLPLDEAAGRVSMEYVWAYPPGIPLLVPGERIRADVIAFIRESERAGIGMKSTFHGLPERIIVMK